MKTVHVVKRRKMRPGPKPRNPEPGTVRPKRILTERQIQANRVRAYRHGRRAKAVSAQEVIDNKIETLLGPEGPALYRQYVESIMHGNLAGTDEISVRAMAELEFVRRTAIRDIQQRGVTIVERVVTTDGRRLGTRVKPHPLLMPLIEIYATLGHTAAAQLLDKRERGATVLNLALARRVKQQRDRLADPNRFKDMPPPPDWEKPTERQLVKEEEKFARMRQEREARRASGAVFAEDLTEEERDAVIAALEAGEITK